MSSPTLLAQCEAAYPRLEWRLDRGDDSLVGSTDGSEIVRLCPLPWGVWYAHISTDVYMGAIYPTLAAALAAPRQAARAAVAELTRKVAPLL